MTDSTRIILGVSRLPRVGRVTLRKVLQSLGPDPEGELSLRDVLDRCRATVTIPEFSPSDLDTAQAKGDESFDKCLSLGISVHPFGWRSYPSPLCRLVDPPALLFSMGRFEPNHRPRIAVIGTRKPSEWGLKTADACATEIAKAGGIVVSGLAVGIDAAAHTASIEHHACTWAVLAHGLHMASPASNRDLAKRILEEGGAWVSEYPPGEAAQQHYFVERDRIQAGLSDAVLVIESGIDSGAMHTVRSAQQARVPVWVTFPHDKINAPDLPEPQQGTWELLRLKNAALVPSAKTLAKMVYDLNDRPAPQPTTTDPLFTR